MGKSYSTNYLSEAMVCMGPVVYVEQEKIKSNTRNWTTVLI